MGAGTSAARLDPNRRRQEVVAAEVRLLYVNTEVGAGVTILAATLLSRLQWGLISTAVIAGWWTYMALVSVARYAVTLRFRQAAPDARGMNRWRTAYAICAGLAGAGWGAAGILLYPEAYLTNQVFLVFVLGGMMLGASSLLAPRPEAFLAFLIPSGFAPAVRLLVQDDETHLAMGLLAAVFTATLLLITGRIHHTVDSSLRLQFDNRDLVEELKLARDETEALNQALEVRVQERTAELNESTGQLRAEIVRREQMEEEVLRARKLESLGVLAGGIAHDFNNFLTIFQGNVELAKERLELDNPVREILDETVDACRRVAFLSSQLLVFAKGGAPVRRLVSVGELVRQAVQTARARGGIRVQVDIADDVRFAEVDPGQISQVLKNILLNAREATPDGGIVEVRAENVALENPREDPRVRISIRDYGGGIRADILPRIFDPYFTTKPCASGLGLATAHAIVARHGGYIKVESEPDRGAMFTLELPASREVPALKAPPAAQLQTGTGRLLVMDDEEALRKLLSIVLTRLGYEVETARDGAEAIALYERRKLEGKGFDAVVLDLTVPGGMGGLEAAAKLKEFDPASKLIVSSGYSDAAVMSDFAKCGFDAVLPKPWTSAEMSEVIRSVLIRRD
jgi:signal transduction histidine kinase/CheY-like chemotaxis protein